MGSATESEKCAGLTPFFAVREQMGPIKCVLGPSGRRAEEITHAVAVEAKCTIEGSCGGTRPPENACARHQND